MLSAYHHETKRDEVVLDNEPLLGGAKRQAYLLGEQKPIYVNECYFKKMINTYEILDENENLSIRRSEICEMTALETRECAISGVFVVSFDIRLGNVIEWQMPNELNLDGIEFKAIASGFHMVQNDIVYFCKGNEFGIAVFENMRVEISEERNVRMKSVGLMGDSFKALRRYVPFLKSQVRQLLDQPGSYDDLIYFWDNKKFRPTQEVSTDCPTEAKQTSQDSSFIDKIFTRQSAIYKQFSAMNQTENRIYAKFVLFFGPAVFCVWKSVLLNKRILIYSLPPVSDLCNRVYCASQLGNTSFNYAASKQLIKPVFYVNVADIDTLEQEPFYIACTSEKIFENKEHLYDIFIKDANFSAVLNENQRSLLKVNSSDKRRYESLVKKMNLLPLNKSTNLLSTNNEVEEETKCADDETSFLEFFTDLNDKIFSALFELENAELTYYVDKKRHENFSLSCRTKQKVAPNFEKPRYVSNEDMRKMGLDPVDDKDFLSELIRFYDFNLTTIQI